jgi:hypothetical protein
MRKLVSLAALGAGICMIYMGHERQESLAGRADSTLARLGERIDGDGHFPTHVKYYGAGFILVAAGALGLGLVRK